VAADGIFLARPESAGDGVPLGVKDLLDTAGLTTTYGSAIFAEHVPAASAESVLLLQRAGYAIVGKTNLHEFAYGITSENPHFGTVPNPVAHGRLERRLRCCARSRSRRRGAGHGLRRLHPHTVGVLRNCRLQAHLRPRVDGRLLSARAELRPCRADGS
jgi:amidase